MFNLLLLALSLQVMADNALTFLILWEAMSLTAYWLVLTEHDQTRYGARGRVVSRHDARLDSRRWSPCSCCSRAPT